MVKRAVFIAVLAGVVLLAVTGVQADTVAIAVGANGLPPTLVATGSGVTSYSSTVGGIFGWTVSVEALGTPPNSEPTLEGLTVDASDISGGVNSLQIYVTQTDVSSPTGINTFLSGFTSNLITPGVTSVAESTYVDTSDTGFGTASPLSSITFAGIGHQTLSATTPSLGPLFSETEIFNIAANGTGTTSDTITISNAPEPGTLTLFGSGLIGLAGLLRRKLALV
jgi:PEP-CTERM motif-containing protein